jgi:CBS-domain-containing membrane protein
MTLLANSIATRPMVLRLSTAAELMTANPLSFDKNAPIHKASALLKFHGLEAAPVIDEYGRPIGVVTAAACADWQEFCIRSSPHGFISEAFDRTPVAEISKPAAEIVQAHDLGREVIEKLLQQRLRRVYVVNDEGELVGVVSTADVLRHLLASGVFRRPMGAGGSLLC